MKLDQLEASQQEQPQQNNQQEEIVEKLIMKEGKKVSKRIKGKWLRKMSNRLKKQK